MTAIREWSVGRLLRTSAALWTVAVVFLFVAGSAGLPNAVLALFLGPLYTPSILFALWTWRQEHIARWHTGKITLLWFLAIIVLVIGYTIENGSPPYLAAFFLPPLFSVTWSWFSSKEDTASWGSIAKDAQRDGAPPLPWMLEQVDRTCARHIAAFLFGGRVEEVPSPTGPRLEIFETGTPNGGEPIAILCRTWNPDERRLSTMLTYGGDSNPLVADAIAKSGFKSMVGEGGPFEVFMRDG